MLQEEQFFLRPIYILKFSLHRIEDLNFRDASWSSAKQNARYVDDGMWEEIYNNCEKEVIRLIWHYSLPCSSFLSSIQIFKTAHDIPVQTQEINLNNF